MKIRYFFIFGISFLINANNINKQFLKLICKTEKQFLTEIISCNFKTMKTNYGIKMINQIFPNGKYKFILLNDIVIRSYKNNNSINSINKIIKTSNLMFVNIISYSSYELLSRVEDNSLANMTLSTVGIDTKYTNKQIKEREKAIIIISRFMKQFENNSKIMLNIFGHNVNTVEFYNFPGNKIKLLDI